MIDFVKFRFNDKQIIENQLKTHVTKYFPEGKFNYNSDELLHSLKGSIENLNISIAEKSGYLSNSLHKYWNSINGKGNQNYNDFSYYDICNCIDNLGQELEYDLSDTTLTNLEFGFNLDMGTINPSQFMDDHVIFHKLKTPCYNPKNKPRMYMKSFIYTNYAIKIYNKSLQYGLHKENILRIELKYKSRKEFNKFGIYSLADLKNPDVYPRLLDDLLKRYDELTIVDSYNGNTSMGEKG